MRFLMFVFFSHKTAPSGSTRDVLGPFNFFLLFGCVINI